MTTTEPIVSLRDVGKRYVKYDDVPTLVAGIFRRAGRTRRSQLWAVRHIDLDVQAGEAYGIIGRNGAGKSTVLGMMAGVTGPTEGVVRVRGRVAPLLRLGVGFHNELTGRENVYINGTILGLNEQEIDQAFDGIVGQAELQEFIDTPVKFYSSGMMARLGFFVAVASQPDLLIVDEVLAVGDVAFQLRSFDRMLELQKQGTTILVVSHALESVRRVCDRVLVMEKGTAYFEGPASDAIGRYHELLHVSWDEVGQGDDIPETQANAPVEILDVELLDEHGEARSNFDSGVELTVRLHARFRGTVTDPHTGLWVRNQSNLLVYNCSSFGVETGTFEAGSRGRFDIRLGLHLQTGTFTLGSWIGWMNQDQVENVRAPAKLFYVVAKTRKGVANLGAEYDIRKVPDGEEPALTNIREGASDPQAP